MKLAACCSTFLRPHFLGQLIESYLRQDYPRHLRELVILDDAGQYGQQKGDGWRIVSENKRYPTLGEKRNATAALVTSDVEGLVVADDDDIYLPHWFSTIASALKRGDWCRPSIILVSEGARLREANADGLFHAAWAYRRDLFERVGRYKPLNNGEDQELGRRMLAANARVVDPCLNPFIAARPYFVWNPHNQGYHVSYMDDTRYDALSKHEVIPHPDRVQIGWQRDYSALDVMRLGEPARESTVRDGRPPVELIGVVETPDGDGPIQGMSILQRALRKRILDGLDWLSIKALPIGRGAIPWFWNWNDRRAAILCEERGRPFICGPNLLFLNSKKPRIDALECGLLDSSQCRLMFCHSPWYASLIASHRGVLNQAPIVQWPYPIDCWPGEPLEAVYDLLIFVKHGYPTQLVDLLASHYPRHARIYSAKYDRNDLHEAARRSRACAYLADDEHGTPAVREILLAGCPIIGMRTGADLMRNGITGVSISQLIFSNSSPNTAEDSVDLKGLLDAIDRAQHFDRAAVRESAAAEFNTERIVDTIIQALDLARID